MKTEAILFVLAATVTFLLALRELFKLLKYRGKTQETQARIIHLNTAAAPEMKVYNSKWAVVSYYVNGKQYVSEDRVNVPMKSEIGDQITVNYINDRPESLFTGSKQKLSWFIIAAIACTVIAVLLSVY